MQTDFLNGDPHEALFIPELKEKETAKSGSREGYGNGGSSPDRKFWMCRDWGKEIVIDLSDSSRSLGLQPGEKGVE